MLKRSKIFKGMLWAGAAAMFLSAGNVQAETANQAPVFSGTDWMQVKQGEVFNEKDVLSRVYAMDYEDGDLTQEIQLVSGEVNTAVCGDYTLSYEVTDSAGNTSTMQTQVTVVQDYDEFGKQVSKTLYTKESADHLLNAGVYRGYYHDRQHLGVYLPEKAWIHVRVANAEEFFQSFEGELKMDLFADDSSVESSYVIPEDGNWLSISAARDYVPFVRTPQSEVAPVLIYYVSHEAEPLTYYHYGDDQEAFSKEWNGNDHGFAVLDSERITMLVPRKDMGRLPGEAAAVEGNLFDSIDEMLLFYKDVQEQYDDFIGVSYDADEAIDKNVRGKYFLKADAHGVGAAYYSGTMYIAQNSDTIKGYLGEDYWMSLHEVAHGYDGDFTQGDLEMGEMINNILAHYYERNIDSSAWELGGYGWSYLQNLPVIEEYYQQMIDQETTYSEMSFDARLYCFLNLLNKTDAQHMMSKLHKEWRRQEGTSVKDFVVETFSEASGYNLVPYFESVGIHVSDFVRSQLYEKNSPVLTPLSRIFTVKEDAQEAMQQLNGSETDPSKLVANGRFGLVSSEELTDLNLKSSMKVHVEVDDLEQIIGQQAVLLDGEKQIAAVAVNGEEVVFEDVAIGEYRLQFPVAKENGYYTDYQSVKVIYGTEAECTVVYHKADRNLLKNDASIRLLGLADQVIADVVTDIDHEKVKIVNKKVEPHYYFQEIYTSVKVLSKDGKQLGYQEFIGNENYTAAEVVIDAPVGSIIEIYHKEPDIRMKVISMTTGLPYEAHTEGVSAYQTTIKYVITENGIKAFNWSEEVYEQHRVEFFETYAKHLETAIGSEAANNPLAYQKQKAELVSVIESFSEEEQKNFKESYPYLFDKEIMPKPTETETPVPTETEVPQPTETEVPQPTETEVPQPTETEIPKPTESEVPQPTETPEVTEVPEKSDPVTTVFSDVYKDWYTDYVQYVYDNGLMTGIKGTTQFAPNANITKAQVAQVLYNMEGQPAVSEKGVFAELKDVYAGEWYANAVAWAYHTGVVTGDTNAKKFFPNADVTREQLALMMYRYASYKKYDVTASSDLSGLQNAENTANWALDGVKWAVGKGLISGVEKNGVKDLAPQGNASRAQVAAILQRFCENVK